MLTSHCPQITTIYSLPVLAYFLHRHPTRCLPNIFSNLQKLRSMWQLSTHGSTPSRYSVQNTPLLKPPAPSRRE